MTTKIGPEPIDLSELEGEAGEVMLVLAGRHCPLRICETGRKDAQGIALQDRFYEMLILTDVANHIKSIQKS